MENFPDMRRVPVKHFLARIERWLNVLCFFPVVLVLACGFVYGLLTRYWFLGIVCGYLVVGFSRVGGFGYLFLKIVFPFGQIRYFGYCVDFFDMVLFWFVLLIFCYWEVGLWFVFDWSCGYSLYPPFLHTGSMSLESWLYFASWLMGWNILSVLLSHAFSCKPNRAYGFFRNVFFKTDKAVQLREGLSSVFRWDEKKFRIMRIAEGIYLLDTEGIAISNDRLNEKKYELENSSNMFIRSINPVDDSPGDFIIREGKLLLDSKMDSAATLGMLEYPKRDDPDWIYKVPFCSLSPGTYCHNLKRKSDIAFIGQKGLGKTTDVYIYIYNFFKQFPCSFLLILDPINGGVEYGNMVWDARDFSGSRKDFANNRRKMRTLSNVKIAGTREEFKKTIKALHGDLLYRSKFFSESGCRDYYEYVSETGYDLTFLPRIVIVVEDLKAIRSNRYCSQVYKDFADLMQIGRRNAYTGVIVSQDGTYEVMEKLRDSSLLVTHDVTRNQADYLHQEKTPGMPYRGVCSLNLDDRNKTRVNGFVPRIDEMEVGRMLGDSIDKCSAQQQECVASLGRSLENTNKNRHAIIENGVKSWLNKG